MAKEQFQKDNAKAYECLRKARQSCIEYITRMVKEHDNVISFNTEYDDEVLAVIYDGGNHPEYASNLCSDLIDVHFDRNGRLCANIEDCDDYVFDRMNTDDIMLIAEVIHDSVIPRLENK